jgi:hypothetical protein
MSRCELVAEDKKTWPVAPQRLARFRITIGQGERRDKDRMNMLDVIRFDRDRPSGNSRSQRGAGPSGVAKKASTQQGPCEK